MERKAEAELMDLDAEVDAYVRGDFSSVNQAFAERLIQICGPIDRALAVDLGTGPADIPIRVWKLRPNWRIVAVDASTPMLASGRPAVDAAGASAAIELKLADAKDTGLPAANFDVIFSNSILHHVSSAAAFWKEVRRLVKTGGVIFLRDLARPESESRARALVGQHAGNENALLKEEFYRSLLSAYTVDEVKTQLRAAGLQKLSVETSSDRHLDVFGIV